MNQKRGLYEKYTKRLLDIICGLLALIVFGWLYVIVAVLVRLKLGSPIIYTTVRAGKINLDEGKEKDFKLYKFRSMTNDTDENGKLLSDVERLTKFGRILRATSLDELPEAINIIKGDMSVVGPRPLPIVYLPYYYEHERQRHEVRPGLTGLAQVNGRNSITWDDKFNLDIKYVNKVSFKLDARIVIDTVVKAAKRSDVGQGEAMPTSLYEERAELIEK